MDTSSLRFEDWFKAATGFTPFPYQTRFATEETLPQILEVPTGLGKTACAVLGWLWRRRFACEAVRSQKVSPPGLLLAHACAGRTDRDAAIDWLERQEPRALATHAGLIAWGYRLLVFNAAWTVSPGGDSIVTIAFAVIR